MSRTILCCLWLVAAACRCVVAAPAGKPRIGAAARAFPDTRNGVFIFADQFPNTQMSEAQLRFAAKHYVGCQKMPPSWTRRIRALNPAFLMLHYQLAVGTGPAAFLDGENWINDFDEVTKHEDWFLHDDAHQRLYQDDWKWYVMDLRFDGDKPLTGFPAYWTRAAIQRMRHNEADGCFADSFTQDILIGQLKPAYSWFTDAEANKTNWLPQLNRFGAYCNAAFHAQPEKFYYLPNLGGLVTTWDRTTKLDVGDGGMNEGFCSGGPGQYYSDDDWKQQMTRVLSLAAKHKIVIGQTGTRAADAEHRWFIVTSYLLSKGPQSFLNMMEHSSLEWYPEYEVKLGAYKDEPKLDVERYWDARWKLFRRNYDKGMVLVNPTAEAVTVADLGHPYKLIAASGGGALSEAGTATGSLSTSTVTSLTVPAHTGRVLLD